MSYMHAYATNNIKKIILSVKLSNAQALGLYSYAFYLNGNTSLSRVCLSQLARIGHALGICIARKTLPILNQYNRKLISNNMRLYYNWAKMGPSSYELESEDEDDLDIYEPKYQLPNSNLNFCNNEHEYTLYSVYCCHFSKLKNLNISIISKFCKLDSKRIKTEIVGLNRKVNDVYKHAKLSLESVINLEPEYENQKSLYLDLIRGAYIYCILCIFSKKLEISKSNEHSTTQTILDRGIELWELISSNTILNDMWSWGPYTVAFHLIHAYPRCSKKQKKSILFILKSIIDYFYKEGYNFNSLNFSILKAKYDLINNS
jgi:hypothetical protein